MAVLGEAMRMKVVGVNENGIRVGEHHQRARLTDRDIALIRALHEEGMTYAQLAEKFDVNKYHIGKICRYEQRASFAVKWKAVNEVSKCEGHIEEAGV